MDDDESDIDGDRVRTRASGDLNGIDDRKAGALCKSGVDAVTVGPGVEVGAERRSFTAGRTA